LLALVAEMGQPQYMHAGARSEISLPHSLQLINAIIIILFF
jgi:hypothetical protein